VNKVHFCAEGGYSDSPGLNRHSRLFCGITHLRLRDIGVEIADVEGSRGQGGLRGSSAGSSDSRCSHVVGWFREVDPFLVRFGERTRELEFLVFFLFLGSVR
jgi:hypothetical protein